jgi:4-oxalocrotonate tautomerase
LVGRTTNYINSKENYVPLVNVKVIEGVFDEDQKRAMIERLTDTMVEIEGENMRGVTWVVVEEVKSGDWGLAGQALTTEAVQALAAGAAA